MIQNPKYMKAFNAGYKQGLYAAVQGSKQEVIMRNDLVHIYGQLILALSQRGWKTDTISAFIETIQRNWVKESEAANYAYDNGLEIETIQAKVKRLTGIDLEQVADTIDGGVKTE